MGRSIVLCFAALLMLSVYAFAQTEEHPTDMGNMECITCHSDSDMVTKPEVVAEWNQSIHSYAGVNCGSCHGDETSFQIRPRRETCEPCHTEQVAVTKSTMPCERCHVAHTFSVHK